MFDIKGGGQTPFPEYSTLMAPIINTLSNSTEMG
jgi:hypothetical protein